jgi:hypothetical protein
VASGRHERDPDRGTGGDHLLGLVGLLALSLFSSFTGGKNDLHFGVDMGVTAAFSLVIYFFALRCRLPTEAVKERMRTSDAEIDGS